ncbi:MAG: AmmeMemoRadiSam system protein B [bacterium]|nr:AmmeMemoRadiSam system protein B [bacterium]
MDIKKRLVFVCLLFFFFSCGISGDGTTKNSKTRDYLTSVNWYPRDKGKLNDMVEQFFSKATTKPVPGRIVGIISPHAGLAYSGLCAANAYKQLLNPSAGDHIKRVILLGVSHRGGFYGAAVSSFDFNSTPLGKIPVDTATTKKLAKEKFFRLDDAALQNEHSLETQLPFLQKVFKNKNIRIVPILLGHLERKDFKSMAAIIKKYIDDKTLVVASTDFTHYGNNFRYAPFKTDIKSNLTNLDMGMAACIKRFDLDGYFDFKKRTGITMCGFTPVGVLMELFSKNHTALLTDYYKSGDREGNYSHSVSYASFVLCKQKGGKKNMVSSLNLNKEEQKTLLTLARDTIEHFLENGKEPNDIESNYKITKNLKQVTGVFVTLNKGGHLRGCIGSIIGQDPLFEGVIDNAINAATKDPRFHKVKKKELKDIDIDISVMTPLQDLDDYKKIRLGIDGVIIKKGYHQSVYLPQVATETGWNLDQFLGQLCVKAGLPSNSYKSSDDMEFLIFQAQVFSEE